MQVAPSIECETWVDLSVPRFNFASQIVLRKKGISSYVLHLPGSLAEIYRDKGTATSSSGSLLSLWFLPFHCSYRSSLGRPELSLPVCDGVSSLPERWFSGTVNQIHPQLTIYLPGQVTLGPFAWTYNDQRCWEPCSRLGNLICPVRIWTLLICSPGSPNQLS